MFSAAMLSSAIDQIQTVVWPQAVQFAIFVSPIVLCVILFNIFRDIWVRYVRAKFYNSLKYVTLEIKLPRDMFKSPLAMESFLTSIHNTSNGSLWAQYWGGEYRPYYSLELVSIEGIIKYFIWCEDRRKAGVLSGLYSQFPGIEVHEVEDYTRGVHYEPKTMKIWAAEFKFTKDDPYPIKTYIDYGLDKDPKEEFKVDPLLPLLEFLGSVKPNQQVWIQIPIQAHIKDQRKPGHLWAKTDLWRDKAEELMNEIMKRDAETKTAEVNPETGYSKIPMLSDADKDLLTALARSVTKLPFDIGIRAIYMAPRKEFDTPFGIGGVIGSLKQFNAENLNGFRPNGDKWIQQFDYPWQDYKGIRRNRLSAKVLRAYKRRSYFYPPFKSKPMVLNTEELATLYHFPGAIAVTPTLERIPSKKSTAPTNLPI